MKIQVEKDIYHDEIFINMKENKRIIIRLIYKINDYDEINITQDQNDDDILSYS